MFRNSNRSVRFGARETVVGVTRALMTLASVRELRGFLVPVLTQVLGSDPRRVISGPKLASGHLLWRDKLKLATGRGAG
jgi:hypothetical protein